MSVSYKIVICTYVTTTSLRGKVRRERKKQPLINKWTGCIETIWFPQFPGELNSSPSLFTFGLELLMFFISFV